MSKDCFLVAGTAANQVPEFKITDTKLYVPVVTLSTQDNVKLLKQLESGFKRTNNCNKYQFEKANQAQNRYLDFLIDPRCKQYYLPTVKIKDYNVMIDGRNSLINQQK